MRTGLDCIPCFVRQSLDTARVVSAEPSVQESIVRAVLRLLEASDLSRSPSVLVQRVHRRIREVAGVTDPYRAAKQRSNRMALRLLPDLRATVDGASDRLSAAMRVAIAGNVIDLGVTSDVSEDDVLRSVKHALEEPFVEECERFRDAVAGARHILYLADNAGEIVFDRLLIERLGPERVTLAVRGRPILNDATVADARDTGLHEIVEVIDNGSDAPGTLLEDCSPGFIRRFADADLILAKGQGNYESLCDAPRTTLHLYRAKCSIVAARAGVPVGACVVAWSRARSVQARPIGDEP